MNKTITAFAATLDSRTLARVRTECERIAGVVNGAAERFAQLGLKTRSEARPFVMVWAAERYNEQIEEGQRGHKLPRDSAAEKAMQRVLNALYPETVPRFGASNSSQADPVVRLLKSVGRSYANLTPGQKRAFKAAVAKL